MNFFWVPSSAPACQSSEDRTELKQQWKDDVLVPTGQEGRAQASGLGLLTASSPLPWWAPVASVGETRAAAECWGKAMPTLPGGYGLRASAS